MIYISGGKLRDISMLDRQEMKQIKENYYYRKNNIFLRGIITVGEEKIIFPPTFLALCRGSYNKRQIKNKKKKNKYINMYTLCVHGRYPQKNE